LNTAAGALTAAACSGASNIPLMIAWFVPLDSSREFGTLNYAADDIIDSEPASPEIAPLTGHSADMKNRRK
jgi:hypothetical protein